MKRALSIWLPQWPLQRLAATRAELKSQAVVLYQLHASGSARVVCYCPRLATAAASPWNDAPGHDAGIRPGMPLAEATALAGLHAPRRALYLEPADPLADRLLLEELAEWCQRFSPTVGVEQAEAAESLLLDVTGLGALCGGEQALAARIVREFAERGLHVRVAIADTPGAAWALAHFADLRVNGEPGDERAILAALQAPVIVPAGETAAALGPLPVEALRLPGETCRLLAELGLLRIGQVAALRRATLLARFGPVLLTQLDRACGLAPEAIVARRPPEELEFSWPFEHPTARSEMIEYALEQLVARLCQKLAGERRGVLRLGCRFEYENQPAEQFIVGLFRPNACERHLNELVRLKLESHRFRESIAAIRLTVLALDRLEFHQRELLPTADHQRGESARALAGLVDRLSNRLGAHAVLRPWLLATAQPEFACQYQSVSNLAARRRQRAGIDSHARDLAKIPGDRPVYLEPQPRPLEVLSVAPEGPPVKFRLSGQDQRIVRVWGPERIETSWWRSRCVRRDYYQVETDAGSRFWLFRHLNSGRWYLHGEFG